ncbi:MAG TPA: TetR/AcrR family transcriptional regulator [Mycobacterium sp.]|nr:TetR/AcrR family transcriptional regulator [Mycobacterium sp.]
MTTGISREVYFETGLDVLSELGYGGLKLAEVCNRLGVTSGSFYHYFSNWSDYTHGLVEHWKQASTNRLAEARRQEPNPRRRIDQLIHTGLNLPHGAEAAIRTWSSLDPFVHAVQADVDRERHQVMRDAAAEILHNDRQAQVFADWALYLLVGYEQCTLQKDKVALQWIAGQLLDCLDAGRFSSLTAQA